MTDIEKALEEVTAERDRLLVLCRRAIPVVLAFSLEMSREPGALYPDPFEYPLYKDLEAATRKDRTQ